MPYVRMNDSFFSGWGDAKGKTNVYVVECDDDEQAEQIKEAAEQRPEMSDIQIVDDMPEEHSGVIITHRHYDELSGPWKA